MCNANCNHGIVAEWFFLLFVFISGFVQHLRVKFKQFLKAFKRFTRFQLFKVRNVLVIF